MKKKYISHVFLWFFISFIAFQEVFAEIDFHPSIDNPFDAQKNIVHYTGQDYLRAKQRNVLFSVEGNGEGVRPADPKTQAGYMYFKLFEANGLQCFNARRHEILQSVLNLGNKRQYDRIFDVVSPYINYTWSMDQKDLTHRWHMHAHDWYKDSFDSQTTSIVLEPTNGFLVFYKNNQTEDAISIFKPHQWDALQPTKQKKKECDPKDNRSGDRIQKNHNIQKAVFDLARIMKMDDAIVSGIETEFMYKGKKIIGFLEPLYLMPKGKSWEQLKRYSFHKDYVSNVLPILSKMRKKSLISTETYEYLNGYVDQKSLIQSILFSYVIAQQDAHNNNFITYCDEKVQKFYVRGLDFEDSLDLDFIEKRNLKFQNPRDSMFPYVNKATKIDEDFRKKVGGWKTILMEYSMKTHGIKEKSINAFKNRIAFIKTALRDTMRIFYRNSFRKIPETHSTYYNFLDKILRKSEIKKKDLFKCKKMIRNPHCTF